MYRPTARAEAVAALLAAGGEVHNESGLASGTLTEHIANLIGHDRPSRSIAALLLTMEHDGEIVRETNGRRTYTIGIAPYVPARLVNSAVSVLAGYGWGAERITVALAAAGLLGDGDKSGSRDFAARVLNAREDFVGRSQTVTDLQERLTCERDEHRLVQEERDELERNLTEMRTAHDELTHESEWLASELTSILERMRDQRVIATPR